MISKTIQNNEQQILIYSAIFITGLVTANMLSSKIVIVFNLCMPAGTIAYAVTYLMTDIVGELYGKKEADKLVWQGFVCLVFCLLLIKIALILPGIGNTVAFEETFNSSTRVILASLAAYLVSQFFDVLIFHKIRNFSVKYKFIRNNVSTIISQFFDTVIFIFIAFYKVVPNIWELIFGLFVAKVILALCDTPFFYFFTSRYFVVSKEYDEY